MRISYEEAIERLAFCDSKSRLPALLGFHWRMNGADFLRLLGEEWSGFDNITHFIDDLWDTAFGWCQQAGVIRAMMTLDEQAAYDALPDVVTVYRGCYKPNKWGLSWSLSKEVAESFPSYSRYRQEGQPLLVTAKAEKRNVIAVKLDRDEAEVITWRPKHVSTRYLKMGNRS